MASQRHDPAEQRWPVLQTFPHRPQLLGSVAVFAQLPPQYLRPTEPQHAPLTQPSFAPHVLPHNPQFRASVSTFVHRTWSPVPHTFGSSAGQTHVPLAHVPAVGQAVPHVPQFNGSSEVFVHTPPQRLEASAGQLH
jgi:hypothetical protein